MIRWLLPRPPIDELITLDAALRRGDLFMVGEQLIKAGTNSLPAGDWALRRAIHDYLASRHALVLTRTASILTLTPLPSPTILALSHFLRALAHIDLKQSEEATSALDAAKSLSGDWPGLHRYSVLAQSTLSLYLSKYQKAEKQLSSLTKNPVCDEDAWGDLQIQRIRGIIAHQQTNYVEALAMIAEAREGYVALGDGYETARCDKALANTFRRLDRYDEAQRYVQSAISYFQKQDTIIPLARCYNTLGSIQHDFNQLDQAIQNFRMSEEYLRTTDLLLERAWTINNIGFTYREMGNLRPALQAYTEARAIVTAPYIPHADAHFAHNQAEILWHQGRIEKAIEQLKYAIDVYLDIGAATSAAYSMRRLATYLMELGNRSEARTLLETCSRTFLQHHQSTQAAIVSIYLGRLHLQEEDVEKAIPLLQKSADILEQNHREYHAADAYVWLGQAYLTTGELAHAADCFKKTSILAPVERVEAAWRASYGLAQIALQQGNMAQASVHLQKAVKHLNRLRRGEISSHAAAHLAQESLPVYVQAIDAAIKTHKPQTAISLLENQKAVQLLNQLHYSQHQVKDEAFLASLQNAQALGRNIAHLNNLRTAIHMARQDNDWIRLQTLETEFQVLAETIEALNAPFASLVQPPTLDIPKLRRMLDERHGSENWACLTFGWLDEQPTTLIRFWLDSNDLHESSVPLSSMQRQLVRLACHPEPSYRRKMLHWEFPSGQSGAPHPPDEWPRLEMLLFSDIIKARLVDIQNLYIIPSGPLVTFPFAAIRVAGIPLGLTTNLSQVPSLLMLQALLLKVSDREGESTPTKTSLTLLPPLRQWKGLICAVSQFPDGFGLRPLQATIQETASLLNQMSPNSLLLSKNKQMRQVFEKLQLNDSLSDYHLIHFATHARLHPYHTQLSHIVLNEDALYVSDILRWRLNARLVVLAACDTAVGHILPGDEQMGLPHAFLVAGADRIIASLWPVTDAATASFFHHFYQALTPGDCTPTEGLRHARFNTQKMHPSPYDWAAFAHIGII